MLELLNYTIGRHQSRIVRTRVASNKSPWLCLTNVGDIYNVPISHGEGKFLASAELVEKLAQNGQIATQYVDLSGNPTMDAAFNPTPYVQRDYFIENDWSASSYWYEMLALLGDAEATFSLDGLMDGSKQGDSVASPISWEATTIVCATR